MVGQVSWCYGFSSAVQLRLLAAIAVTVLTHCGGINQVGTLLYRKDNLCQATLDRRV